MGHVNIDWFASGPDLIILACVPCHRSISGPLGSVHINIVSSCGRTVKAELPDSATRGHDLCSEFFEINNVITPEQMFSGLWFQCLDTALTPTPDQVPNKKQQRGPWQ